MTRGNEHYPEDTELGVRVVVGALLLGVLLISVALVLV